MNNNRHLAVSLFAYNIYTFRFKKLLLLFFLSILLITLLKVVSAVMFLAYNEHLFIWQVFRKHYHAALLTSCWLHCQQRLCVGENVSYGLLSLLIKGVKKRVFQQCKGRKKISILN